MGIFAIIQLVLIASVSSLDESGYQRNKHSVSSIVQQIVHKRFHECYGIRIDLDKDSNHDHTAFSNTW